MKIKNSLIYLLVMCISLGNTALFAGPSFVISEQEHNNNQDNSSVIISEETFMLADTRGFRVNPINSPDVGNQKRFALVIGNSLYENSPLKNPENDAEDVTQLLEQVGFDVTVLKNASKKEMILEVRDFGKKLKQSKGVGLFYYAGHGMQVNNSNYLIPVDAQVEHENQIEFEAMDMNRVLAEMDAAKNAMNFVVLDACRDNPFHRSFRSSTKGLAQMDAPSGTLIAYSTAPGKVASDGQGRNGIYTKSFVKHMAEPGLTVEEVFKRVRADVMLESENAQIPWESSSLVGVFYFLPSDGLPAQWIPPVLQKPNSQTSQSMVTQEQSTPWYKRWYVWAIGAAIVGAAVYYCSPGGDGGDAGQGGEGGGCR